MTRTLKIGTSGWSYPDWVGPFYPAGARPIDFLSLYAERFDCVEVDSTYYAIPNSRTVQGWRDRTPEGFRFALKAPGAITHEKVLVDCDRERDRFLDAVSCLGDKLWIVLLQFGYFNKKAFAGPREFFTRLDSFLHGWPPRVPVAVEIRNRTWLGDDYFGLLKSHRAAAAVAEHVHMPRLESVLAQYDVRTGPVLYTRLIGDRYGIEKVTTTWDRVVIDRSDRIDAIAASVAHLLPKIDVVVFVNNHFAGHGPASCAAFLEAMARATAEGPQRE
ncbi:MAG: DUF72 domain-containing protein [Phycisphaerales bacterium]|nr:MAG: DUF72 domain-containing protein [Phycisphaerales bacterium]